MSQLQRTLLVTAAAVVAAPLAAAQSVCFEPYSTAVCEGASRFVVALDIEGDGDVDLAMNSGGGKICLNDGNGVFTAPATIGAWVPEPGIVVDMDGDGHLDVAGAGGVLWNQGNGSYVSLPFLQNEWVLPNCAVGDVDGDGLPDVVGVYQSGPGGSSVGYTFHNDGARGVWATSFDVQFDVHYGATGRMSLADVDADGDLDLVIPHAYVNVVSISRNDGTGYFGSAMLLSTVDTPLEVVVAQLDGDPALDLAAIDLAGNLSVWRALSPGVFAPRVDIPCGAGVAFALSALDLDADGDLDLAAPMHVNGTSGPHGRMAQFLNDGLAGFTVATAFTSVRPLVGAVGGDFDRDADVDFATIVSVTGTTNTIAVRRSCRTAGRVVCAGDGTGGVCPCSNTEPGGSQHGCINSSGVGAGLRGSGTLYVPYDTCVLIADGMPATTTAFFFQGTAAANGGLGTPFGDGLSCATGTIRRIATKPVAGGIARYPESGEPPISVRGQVLGAGTRTYQVLYRNVVGYCTPATFNLTNGLDVVWR